nr:hypothetical protein [uncultured Blautia sp.]
MDSGRRLETVTIAPADYPTKIQTAMRGKQTTPDIIVGSRRCWRICMRLGF